MATYSSNSYLSEYGTKMTANAKYIFNFFSEKGWTKNSICAMLGNIQRESTINPGIWQNLDEGNTSLGIGLVQWTPATKLISWCNSNNLNYLTLIAQCKRIIYELENGLQYYATDDYPETFSEFTKSTKSVEYLTYAFLKNYERAGVEAVSERIKHAEYWYNHLSGTSYTPRLNSNGMEGSIYWYSGNPFYIAGYGLPNCTCYAWGRFWEISDPNGDGSNKPTLPTSDAGKWFEKVSGYETGNTPKLGAVICWSANDGGAGHVAIVEEIKANGDIVVSQSGWGSSYFWTSTVYKENGYNTSGYTFQGFIYNPFAGTSGGGGGGNIPLTRKRKKYNFILMGRRKRMHA